MNHSTLSRVLPLAILVLLTGLVAASAIAHAQTNSAPSPESLSLAQGIDKLISVVLPSLVVSIATAGLGYMKENSPGTFDPVKLIATFIVAIIVGVASALYGLSYNSIVTYLANAGATVYIYWIAQLIATKWGYKITPTPSATTTLPATTPPATTPPAATTPVVASTPEDLTVRIVDGDGDPVAGAKLDWYDEHGHLSGVTDSNGWIDLGVGTIAKYQITASGFVTVNGVGAPPAVYHLSPAAA